MDQMTQGSTFSLCARAVLRDALGRVLLLRRAPGHEPDPDSDTEPRPATDAGLWEFPGGKAKAGEPFDGALLREVEEETKLTATLDRLAGSRGIEHGPTRIVCIFMEGRVTGGDLTVSPEHTDARWVTVQELADMAAVRPDGAAGAADRLSSQLEPFVRDYCASLGYGPTVEAGPPPRSLVSTELLNQQVGEFTAVLPSYKEMEEVLKRVLTDAIKAICPFAFVQARAKKVDGFAEKIVRKNKYTDPVHQITDLCGARVITQTLTEAESMCRYIRSHFEIDEKNSLDARSRLMAAEFGYRSVHYIVSFRKGVFPDVPERLLGLKAEIQVRTVLQHAWSDIGHDRLYKSGFRVPEHWQREAARIAAMLESADDAFTRLVEGIERYRCNFGAYLTPDEIRREIEIAEAVLGHDPTNVTLMHRLARLLIAANDCALVITLTDGLDIGHPGLLCCRGMALCHVNKADPGGPGYAEGRACYRKAAALDPNDVEPLVKLAETAPTDDEKLDYYDQAYHAKPTDPGALSGYIRQRIARDRTTSFVPLLRPSIESAIALCEDQVRANVNLPWALYAISGFHLLLGPGHERRSLDALMQAVHVPQQRFMMANALAAADMLASVERDRHDVRCVKRLLIVALRAHFPAKVPEDDVRALASPDGLPIEGPVVIVAGGCDDAHKGKIDAYRHLLDEAFVEFHGTVISGGTEQGVAGLVAGLGAAAPDRIHTIGYLPKTIPADGSAKPDERYHQRRLTDGLGEFTPIEPIQNWIDLLASGIQPKDVRLLGINGGQVAAFEYRLAWALGAQVAIVRDSGREADILEQEIRANGYAGVLVLPPDPATLRAFLRRSDGAGAVGEDERERLARIVHARFLDEGRHKNPDPAMRPWERLDEGMRQSNLDQVSQMVATLRAAGLSVEPSSFPVPLLELSDGEIETMAELEHGRWTIERLRAGWHAGERRDATAKISPCLVAWKDLDAADPNAKKWDCDNVRRFPALLAEVGLKVVRCTQTR